MDFTILDDSVSYTMNIFLILANIINLVYNIPQMVKTYKIKSTRDFSSTFLFMRVIGNTIWLAYSIELNTFLFFISNVISVGSSAFISSMAVEAEESIKSLIILSSSSLFIFQPLGYIHTTYNI